MKHEVKFEGSKLLASASHDVDPNGDGQTAVKVSLSVEVDLAEIPDEVMSVVLKKRSEKKA